MSFSLKIIYLFLKVNFSNQFLKLIQNFRNYKKINKQHLFATAKIKVTVLSVLISDLLSPAIFNPFFESKFRRAMVE